MLGALIGKQKGRNIEIMNSFELSFVVIENDIVIDREYYNTKEEQCKLKQCNHGSFLTADITFPLTFILY